MWKRGLSQRATQVMKLGNEAASVWAETGSRQAAPEWAALCNQHRPTSVCMCVCVDTHTHTQTHKCSPPTIGRVNGGADYMNCAKEDINKLVIMNECVYNFPRLHYPHSQRRVLGRGGLKLTPPQA